MAEYIINQELPISEIVESGYLESLLENLSSSYKLFWLKGIFIEIMKDNKEIEYRRIVARMIAAAWYPVVFFNLSLGFNDNLSNAIWYIHKELHVNREEKEERIVDIVYSGTDLKLTKMIKDFTNLVPYRLLRPFYQREIDYERKNNPDFKDSKVNALIEYYNKRDHNFALYFLDRINQKLRVSGKWSQYIKANAPVIEGWLNYKLIYYIQKRNPNVPAISFKIFQPTSKDRNLTRETKYWTLIQEQMPLYDIYTEKEFTSVNYEEHGGFSVDHFIPWSFVLHNEVWNLYPTFKNVNSGKNNKLPDKERYLNQFCEYQYQAFMIAKHIKRVQKFTEQYLMIKKDIFSIEESDRGHDAFVNAMKQTIEPLYQIANNQGYGIWWYSSR